METESTSAQVRVGRYVFGKLQASDARTISRKELMDECGIKTTKRVGTIFRMHFRGMFSIESDDIYPRYFNFEGKDGFLEHLGLINHALEKPGNRESRAGNSRIESGFHRSSFGSTRRRI